MKRDIEELATTARGNDEDAAEAAVKQLALDDGDRACELLCDIAAGAPNESVAFAAMKAIDKKLEKGKAEVARIFPMVIASCERYPIVDEREAFGLTFSDHIYGRKKATPRELALVRRQLHASESLQSQSITIIGMLKDKESIATLYELFDERAAADFDPDDELICDIAQTLVVLGIGGATLKGARNARVRAKAEAKKAAAHETLVRVLRDVRPKGV